MLMQQCRMQLIAQFSPSDITYAANELAAPTADWGFDKDVVEAFA